MKRILILATLVAALPGSWPGGAAAGPAEKPPIVVPFELVNRHVFVRVGVGGRALGFVLDTGAPSVIIDLGRAKELGLTTAGELRAHGAAGLVTGAFLRDAKYTIPGVPLSSDTIAAALPLQELANGFGRDFDGILGAEFIRQFVVEIDYSTRVLRLHDRDAFAYAGPGDTIPIRFNHSGHPVFDGEITPIGGSAIPARIVLDIGSSGALDLRNPYVTANHLPGPGARTIRALGLAGAGGDASGSLGRVASLRIGAFTIDRPVAFFSEDRVGANAMTDVDASIGQRIAERFRIFLDYARRRMILEPTGGGEPPERAFSGASIEAVGADYRTLRVRQVASGGPAARAGLAAGDVIESIDARRVTDLTLDDVLGMLEKPVTRTIAIRDGSRTRTVTLTPEPLA
jgi:hypothetical protein